MTIEVPRLWMLAGLAVLVVALPSVLPSFYVHIMVLMVILAIFAMSLDILMGYVGLPSLGHAAFFGIAAYGSGLLVARYDGTWWEGVLLGLACSSILAALFGFIALRVRGLYFLLITLAFAQVLWGAANRWGSFTGGYNGLRGIPKFMETFGGTLGAYYLALCIFSVLGLAMYLIVHSPFGLTLQGIRDSESRMEALGYHVWLHKYVAFVVSAFFAGAAGVMSAYYKGFVSPFDLSIGLSAEALLMVILGGTGTLFGPIIGAVSIVALRNFLSIYIPHWLLILGLIFILIVFLAPNGVMGWFKNRDRRAADDVDSPSDQEPPQEKLVVETKAKLSGPEATNPSDAPDLRLEGITKLFGGMAAVRNISLEIHPGERVAILGPNGAGKTSLFHLISGSLRPTEGRIMLFGQDVSRLRTDQRVARGLGRTFQITNLFSTLSVSDNLRLSLFSREGRRFVAYRLATSFDKINAEADRLLNSMGLWEQRDVEVRYLSYGHQRQLEVVMAVALQPQLLLLDEPTAGLSAAESASMTQLIRGLDDKMTLLIIEHDMDVAFEVADKIMVFHHGEQLAEGTVEEIRTNAQVRQIYLGRVKQ